MNPSADEDPEDRQASPTATSAPITLGMILGQPKYHVARESWFELAQDDGIEMSADEVTKYGTPAKGKRKNKHFHVAFRGRLYPKIYQLAGLVVSKIKEFPEAYPRFNHSTKNLSSVIHPLGRRILQTRKAYARADIHNLGRDVAFIDLIQSSAYSHRDTFYILSQQPLLEYIFLEKFGPPQDTKKVTTDDKVRVAGIAFMESSMRQCITSMIGKARGSRRRSELDAASGLSRAGFNMLHSKFIDKEVVVEIPEAWSSEETQQTMDERHGPGTFANYCTFNPNNLARLELPWTAEDVMRIFEKMVAEYQAMMDFYTKGTGGGAGASEHYADWMHRPAECVVGYIHQPCNFYLSVVHIWDKQYNWLLTDEKDPLPQNCAIDDSTITIDFDNNQNDKEGDDEFSISRFLSPTPGRATNRRSFSSSTTKGRSAPKERRAVAALEKSNDSWDSSKSAESEIITIMRRMEGAIAGEGTDDTASKTRALVEDVNRTRTLIRLSEGDLKRLKKKKRKLSSNTEKNANKIKAIKIKIKRQERELETMETTRYNQTRRLDELNKILAEEREGGTNAGRGKNGANIDSGESNGNDTSSDDESSDNNSSDEVSSDDE